MRVRSSAGLALAAGAIVFAGLAPASGLFGSESEAPTPPPSVVAPGEPVPGPRSPGPPTAAKRDEATSRVLGAAPLAPVLRHVEVAGTEVTPWVHPTLGADGQYRLLGYGVTLNLTRPVALPSLVWRFPTYRDDGSVSSTEKTYPPLGKVTKILTWILEDGTLMGMAPFDGEPPPGSGRVPEDAP